MEYLLLPTLLENIGPFCPNKTFYFHSLLLTVCQMLSIRTIIIVNNSNIFGTYNNNKFIDVRILRNNLKIGNLYSIFMKSCWRINTFWHIGTSNITERIREFHQVSSIKTQLEVENMNVLLKRCSKGHPCKILFWAKRNECNQKRPKGKVIRVSSREEPMDMSSITDRAAETMFFTELIRGFAVTLGKIFQEPGTINYPFEKGPISPRLVYFLNCQFFLV